MDGYLRLALGVGLLLTARAFTQLSVEANSRIFSPRFGRAVSWAGAAFGVVVGLAAILAGDVTIA